MEEDDGKWMVSNAFFRFKSGRKVVETDGRWRRMWIFRYRSVRSKL